MKIGILGAGNISRKVAPALAALPEIECWAVASRELKKAENFAREFGFTKAYDSYEALLSDPAVELVADGVKIPAGASLAATVGRADCANGKYLLKATVAEGVILSYMYDKMELVDIEFTIFADLPEEGDKVDNDK